MLMKYRGGIIERAIYTLQVDINKLSYSVALLGPT